MILQPIRRLNKFSVTQYEERDMVKPIFHGGFVFNHLNLFFIFPNKCDRPLLLSFFFFFPRLEYYITSD